MARSTEKRDSELAALLEEVRSLKQDIDVLKSNPIIGEAVAAALTHARDFQRRNPGSTALPPTYQVAVRQLPGHDDIVLPGVRATRVRGATRKAAGKATATKARGAAATRKGARTRKGK